MITKQIKMVPKIYYIVDGVEFDGNKLFETLETITSGYNGWVSELSLPDECPYELAKLGYLWLKLFYYEDIVYCDTEDGKAKALFNELLKLK